MKHVNTQKETEEYYEAFTLLSAMLEESPLKVCTIYSNMYSLFIVHFLVSDKLTHRLKPGEALLLNNRRVLHSRNSFKLNGGSRYIQVTQT